MNELVRDLEVIQAPSSTEGLDDLFADATQCEAVAEECEALATHCEYTIIEASQCLKVSPSTVYRRIRAGKYKTVEDGAGGIKVLLPRNASQCETDASQCVAVESHCDAVETPKNPTDNETLATAVVQMAQKLEAANYRIGWLESQLQEREKEVKLLTDSQHKAGWWARFTKWCAGQ